jgi:hypothetical protein
MQDLPLMIELIMIVYAIVFCLLCDLQFVSGGCPSVKRASAERSSSVLPQQRLKNACCLQVIHSILDVLENVLHKAIHYAGL